MSAAGSNRFDLATHRLLVTLSFLGSVIGGAVWLALALWPLWI